MNARGEAMEDEIVALSADLVAACADLYVAVFAGEPWNESWTPEAARERLGDLLELPRGVGVAWVEGEPPVLLGFGIGYAEQSIEGPSFYLAELCVRPDAQGRGIGTRLLRHLEWTAAELGARCIRLGTREGTPAAAFYAARGYRVASSVLVMTRHLEEPNRGRDTGPRCRS